MSKKSGPLPERPQPPCAEKILHDVKNAKLDDVIFSLPVNGNMPFYFIIAHLTLTYVRLYFQCNLSPCLYTDATGASEYNHRDTLSIGAS